MQKLYLSPEELATRGGLLDHLMDTLFDLSILTDADCRILNVSRKASSGIFHGLQVIGRPVDSILTSPSPFNDAVSMGKPAKYVPIEILGQKYVSNIFPIEYDGKIVGVLGTFILRDLRRLKHVFSLDMENDPHDAGKFYNDVSRLESGYRFQDFIGKDPAVSVLIEKAKKAAGVPLPVLIVGETGTGKEIIAGAIHNLRYPNAVAPYVTINCTAIPDNLLESELFGYEKGAFTGATSAKKGKFELASGGDILLDEIGDMNMQMQSKLLRVLESLEFERVGGNRIIPMNAGIITSTNKNLRFLSDQHQFRTDLYYRLNTIELFIPPLRHRKGDIPLLLRHFSDELDVHLRLTSSAMEFLIQYPWPGNVRQLRHLIHRLSIFYDGVQITSRDIALELGADVYRSDQAEETYAVQYDAALSPMERSERKAVSDALDASEGNMSAAARALGISRGTLYSKVRKYHLEKK